LNRARATPPSCKRRYALLDASRINRGRRAEPETHGMARPSVPEASLVTRTCSATRHLSGTKAAAFPALHPTTIIESYATGLTVSPADSVAIRQTNLYYEA